MKGTSRLIALPSDTLFNQYLKVFDSRLVLTIRVPVLSLFIRETSADK